MSPKRCAMPRSEARRALTTSTRLFWPTSAPIALTMVCVPPVPGSVFTTMELPAAICGDDLSPARRRRRAAGCRSAGSRTSAPSACDLGVALVRRSTWRWCCRRGRRARGGRCFAASAAIPDATSAKEDTTSRGLTLNHSRWRGEAAQAVDHRVRLEGAVVVGERDEGGGVERDLELLLQGPAELRVEERVTAQLDLEVTTVTTDGERPQQHGRAVARRRRGSTRRCRCRGGWRRCRARVDSSRPFAAMQAGGDLRGAQRHVVADQARQQRRLAGDELREATRMRHARTRCGCAGCRRSAAVASGRRSRRARRASWSSAGRWRLRFRGRGSGRFAAGASAAVASAVWPVGLFVPVRGAIRLGIWRSGVSATRVRLFSGLSGIRLSAALLCDGVLRSTVSSSAVISGAGFSGRLLWSWLLWSWLLSGTLGCSTVSSVAFSARHTQPPLAATRAISCRYAGFRSTGAPRGCVSTRPELSH